MRLVVMGDLHYSAIDETIPGLYEARADFFEAFIREFFSIQADAHISLGDLTNYGATLELEGVYNIIRKYDKPFYHALGNHDLYAQPRKNVLEITGQARYHSITTEHAVFVFLDTAKEMDYEDWGGWVDDEQLQWLKSIVQASGTKPMLVFAHHPVYNTTTRSDREKGSIHQDIDMWSVLSEKEGVGIYFNGHTHVESIIEQENWTFVQLPACLDLHTLRMVEIDEKEIRITPVDITNEKIVGCAPTLYNNMKHFTHNPEARGKESDRSCTVSLVASVK
ncbi:metallophosphoesterase [Alkalihalobacillus sp. BA299]|uniref:metallophosphoesterase family protein n=1 Tax=Alkalihalobacillus sp. BA299 TaxID=2815938 RepID=UPI001ADAEA67|nr:metallophosphoesterase family protein [Alkalihalobacillus sp. BA299]